MSTLTGKDIHKGFLQLINAKHAYRASESETGLTPVASAGHEVMLISTAAALLQAAMTRLAAGGQIAAVSGFRSRGEQEEIYADSLRENGQAFTEKYVALPGHSEHQSGLAVDMALIKPDIDYMTPDFPYEGICQQFREAIVRYGFIERYPKGKESVTGIGHEPWHFRYVGIPHAAIMKENGLVLEEYIDMLRGYPFGGKRLAFHDCERAYEIGFIEAENGLGETERPNTPYLVSGNNVDGFIVTAWR